MKWYVWSAFALLVLGVTCWGCAGGLDPMAKAVASSLNPRNGQTYVKRVGLGVLHAPSTELGREAAGRLAQAVAATLQGQAANMKLLKAWQDETLQKSIDSLKDDPVDVAAKRWRTDGFQCIATASLPDVHLVTEKTGIFWFRKDRYFIKVGVVFDLYDTLSGAKLVFEVAERSLKISRDAYEGLQSGAASQNADLDELLADLGNEFGQEAAEALRKHPWQTTIISSDAQHIVLAAGRSAGLQIKDRLVVNSGNRLIDGASGKYVLPGMKIAEVDIKQVEEHRSNAVVLKNGSVQAGDMVMPVGPNP